ncbi:ABC-type nitrate/sulfonate/bicarbonate transport system, permease component [Eubacterium oxidoreducens]|uniref:ABC-type nitrate/sulfonate/bicarbonate transport system, permease component n=2 Tax=Eubacterium oxidoreducens TaxID=1732 RepID=A0A1G6C4A2_EUBOX|nr:ABC-type nitrate/sulfonate/bicarbonate transport system, permease component [Eubacterium oxidoreducens]
MLEIVPHYMLPSPVSVVQAFIEDFPLLMGHAKTTVVEALIGLAIGTALGFLCAVLMNHFKGFYKAFYPIVVITQTIPTVAIAPLLILWLGYAMAPKIVLVIITAFFPITIGLLEGFASVDREAVSLFRAMGAKPMQIFRYMKMPATLGEFFSGLRISAAYSIVGAVVAEWLGGYNGLGVYMMRVKKSYSYDKMFAVIVLISAISLLLMWGLGRVQKVLMPWEKTKKHEE